jgi:hypothetical protein
MKRFIAPLLLTLLAGCSTMNDLGIGGEPLLQCRKGQATLDDRIAGPDQAHLSLVRRFKDGDLLCAKDEMGRK